MDGSNNPGRQLKSPADVAEKISQMKRHMPMTYREVKRKAEEFGNDAYKLVRQGIAGLPNKFYAIEGGYVLGTPFDLPCVPPELAVVMMQFGSDFMIRWAPESYSKQGGNDGTR